MFFFFSLGPSGSSIRAIGSKSGAKQLLRSADQSIPLIPGYDGSDQVRGGKRANKGEEGVRGRRGRRVKRTKRAKRTKRGDLFSKKLYFLFITTVFFFFF